MKFRKLKTFDFFVNIITIISLLLQLVPKISQYVKNVLLIIISLFIIILIIIKIINRENILRPKMIKKGKKLICNAIEKVVLFGGDLSWKSDYMDCIAEIIKNSKIVEVYVPRDKIESSSKKAKSELVKRMNELKKNGAKVYLIKKDYGLRLIMTDPHTYNNLENMEIMLIKRLFRDPENNNRNKYRIKELKYINNTDKDECNILVNIYSLILENIKEFSEKDYEKNSN